LWKRKLASLSRWLHIYLSMASFGILFFFAATGYTLNHQDWFTNQQRTTQSKGRLDPRWTQSDNVDKLQIVEYLRAHDHIHGALDDFRIDPGRAAVSFKGPAYEADVTIDRQTGAYDINETNAGLIALVNDLHKGRDAGPVWAKIIDVSALLMALVSLTGLILLFYLHKRRMPGMIMLFTGAALAIAIYKLWVP
jgi:hypothetical protein